jgi:hypothetical protein
MAKINRSDIGNITLWSNVFDGSIIIDDINAPKVKIPVFLRGDKKSTADEKRR